MEIAVFILIAVWYLWVYQTTYDFVITQDGGSALMVAAMEGKTEVVIELVKAGANVDMQDNVCQYTMYICVCCICRTYIQLLSHHQRWYVCHTS